MRIFSDDNFVFQGFLTQIVLNFFRKSFNIEKYNLTEINKIKF